MAFDLTSIIGSNLGAFVKDAVGAFKIPPEKKAEFQAAVDENAAQLAMKQLELQEKMQASLDIEIQTAAAVITAESNSQSWLPRNVRPLLLLMWGAIITFNPATAIISQFTAHPITPIVLDPWIYKLTAIGFTGYVTARTWEKVTEKDK